MPTTKTRPATKPAPSKFNPDGFRSAPAPTRAAQKITIAFGLVHIPVKLYTATQDTKVVRFEATGTGSKANTPTKKASAIPAADGKRRTVPQKNVYRVATATDGTKVKLSGAEIDTLNANLAEGPYPIEALADVTDLGTLLFPEKLYQVRADEGFERAYGLLLETLAVRQTLAIINVSLSGNAPRPCALTPGGDLLVLSYADGVRGRLELPKVELSAEERALAFEVLDSIPYNLTAVSKALVNQSAVLVQAFVDARAKDQKLAVPGATTRKASGRVTLLAQLREAARRPVGR